MAVSTAGATLDDFIRPHGDHYLRWRGEPQPARAIRDEDIADHAVSRRQGDSSRFFGSVVAPYCPLKVITASPPERMIIADRPAGLKRS